MAWNDAFLFPALSRNTMHDFYRQDDIDTLFVGTSRTYQSIRPDLVDENLQTKSFVAASMAQPIAVSKTLIMEANAIYGLDAAFVEIGYGVSRRKDKASGSGIVGVTLITDYMRPGLRKAALIRTAVDPRSYVEIFVPARRNAETLFSPDAVYQLLAKKLTREYLAYEPFVLSDELYYVERGFVASERSLAETLSDGSYAPDKKTFKTVELTKVSDDWKNGLYELISYCDENGISLYFYTPPVTDTAFAALNANNEYAAFHQLVAEIAGETHPFYDYIYNMEKTFSDKSLFADDHHINANGAAVFTKSLCEKVKKGE